MTCSVIQYYQSNNVIKYCGVTCSLLILYLLYKHFSEQYGKPGAWKYLLAKKRLLVDEKSYLGKKQIMWTNYFAFSSQTFS